MSLAKRTVTSAGWNISASLVAAAIGFIRSILLARLLAVNTFGIYAFASSWILVTSAVPVFGMAGAFIHRAPESEDEDQAAAAHFTLKLIFTTVWALIVLAGALVFTQGETRLAFVVLTVVNYITLLTETPYIILVRRVVHRRLAAINLLTALLMSLAAVFLAWRGAGIWALLITDTVSMILSVFFLYIWRPFWRPHLSWDRPRMRYYLRFGLPNMLSGLLYRLLDEVDDLWTGTFLGATPLGYYSRAFQFATFPRKTLATPITDVASGTYAELKDDRLSLSRAFFRTNAFMTRTSFYMAGVLALVAPEFIYLLIGAKWLPMLQTFRLMLIYTMLDPLKGTISNLFIALGMPQKVLRARTIQLVALVSGLFVLGYRLGIDGVALAVDAMLVVGIVLLVVQARPYIDFSVRRLFFVPTVALLLGLLAGFLLAALPVFSQSYWVSGAVKAASFSLVYLGLLAVLERGELVELSRELLSLLRTQPPPVTQTTEDEISSSSLVE